MLENYSSLGDRGLEVFFSGGDRSLAGETLEHLDRAVEELSKYFSVERAEGLRAILTPSRKEYERLVVNLLGVDIEIPSNPGRIAQPQKKDLVFLAPSAYEEHSTYKFEPAEFGRLVFHETVHVFEELLSPNIELVPRWWSEGLAVYLSRQWKYYDQFKFRKPVVKGLLEGEIPEFEEIERRVDLSYDWGWTAVMFLEQTRGREVIRRTVLRCSRGNILETLGMGKVEFAREWKHWLQGEGKKVIVIGVG